VLTNSCHGTWFSPINKRQYGAPLTLTTFGAQFKNDGHYFCGAGGNRPDGLNEPVTRKKISAPLHCEIIIRR
ncbi:hypothetical protein, partial [Escherichia albertii]|uniref:hypothetical protein n=1 Tax=Escherichia albertii TaxID=208962 RepID=UPI001A7E0632